MVNMQRNTVFFLIASLLLFVAPAQADDSADDIKKRIGSGNPVKGKARSELCQGCHGERGISYEDVVPNLAGQYGSYIAKQLRNFQSGERTHQIMSALAQTVNDVELSDIAAYFSSQKKMQGNGKGSNPVAINLFTKGDLKRDIPPCMSCHGKNGKGQSPGISTYPVIGGQNKAYLVAQLTQWRNGERKNSPGGIMNKVAKSLTDAEIDALTSYISGL